MEQKKERRVSEGSPGPGAWIVTFTDCMTLLLCFFVLLLAFSTFDELSLQRLAAAFETERRATIFNDEESKEQVTESPKKPTEDIKQGTRVTDDVYPDRGLPPKSREVIIGDEAYKDRRVIYLSSSMLFGGRSSELTEDGKRRLDLIAGFLQVKPCRVVIGENRPTGTTGPGYLPNIGMKRSWSVVDYLTGEGGIDSKCFSISADGGAYSPRAEGPTIEIVMLSRRIRW